MRGVLVLAALLVTATAPPAAAAPACVATPLGIQCTASGGSTTSTTTTTTLPPVRYVVVGTDAAVGDCWYWSRYGPGLDSWNPGDEHALILTRTYLPECPATRPGGTISTTVITSRAWEVFRSFPLRAPAMRLDPWPAGFTNIPSRLTVLPPPRLHHAETLPDGTRLRVRARVVEISVSWGDGSPTLHRTLADAVAGRVDHTYGVKTCTRRYRREHPAGNLCHPQLARYPVVVAHVWVGEYVVGGRWVRLGTIERPKTLRYDIDEIIGVPHA